MVILMELGKKYLQENKEAIHYTRSFVLFAKGFEHDLNTVSYEQEYDKYFVKALYDLIRDERTSGLVRNSKDINS